jgi:hypothetical protein
LIEAQSVPASRIHYQTKEPDKERFKMRTKRNLVAVAVGMMLIATSLPVIAKAEDHDRDDRPALRGRIIAVGIPGASSVSAVGTFLPGGPIGKAPLNAFTHPGQILDPVRILVASSSNFGAPLARTDQRPGTFLSIDPNGPTMVVAPDFAAAGGQASSNGGRVQVYTANNAAFLNSIENPNANTANFVGVSNPLGLSINWAFGRLWPVSAPTGLEGVGVSSILDPQGWGLKGAPNAKIGGEYAGDLTNRGQFPPSTAQVIPGGLNTGAVGTAFLGASPDGTGKAVFVVVQADGSIVQEHTLQGLDGLAGPGTISPLFGRRHHDDDDADGDRDDHRGVSPRLGVILNWTPTMVLFVSEPFENRIAVLNITPDAKSPSALFRVTGMSHIRSDVFDEPVDLAPAILETDDTNFSSNTTLNEGSDFYVANRGNNTIVRMRQDGTVVAVRRVTLANGESLGSARINGIATQYTAGEEVTPPTKIWVTVTGHLPGIHHSNGAVLELPAF